MIVEFCLVALCYILTKLDPFGLGEGVRWYAAILHIPGLLVTMPIYLIAPSADSLLTIATIFINAVFIGCLVTLLQSSRSPSRISRLANVVANSEV